MHAYMPIGDDEHILARWCHASIYACINLAYMYACMHKSRGIVLIAWIAPTLWSGPSLTGNVEFGDLGFQESGNLVCPCNKKRLQGLDQEEQHLLDLQRARQSVPTATHRKQP